TVTVTITEVYLIPTVSTLILYKPVIVFIAVLFDYHLISNVLLLFYVLLHLNTS
uniref:Ovule protein n=1 Tax=Steinernema glaseri TaxID=37863 RepID=A0A1I7YB48_9BILA